MSTTTEPEGRMAPEFIHLQQPVPGWLNAAERLPQNGVVKALQVQWLAEAKARNPKIRTNLRYWNDGVQQVNPDDTEAVREKRAREWFDAFLDGTFWEQSTAGIAHKDAADSIGWWNEYYAGSQTAAEKELWWRQERTAARIFNSEYLPRFGGRKVRLTIAAAPVGNDIPLQTAQTAVMYNCIVDYHGYDKFLAVDTRDPLSWQYHSGRWATMDAQFRAAGYTVDWWHGEWGPYMDVMLGYVAAFSNEANFLAALRTEIMEIRSTHAYHTGRFWATPALFTTGGGEKWKGYNVDSEALLVKIADIFNELWVPVQPPPQPATRDPEPATPSFLIDYVSKLPTVSSPYPFPIRKLTDIKSVVVHHSAGSTMVTPESINLLHQSAPRDYPRIAYHIYVKSNSDGTATAYKTNLFTDRSWHAGPAGNDGLGICMAGDFTGVPPTEAQIAVVGKIVQWINDVLGVKPLIKHKDVAATQCPGNTVDTWWSRLTEEPVTTWQKTVILVHPSATLEQYVAICKLAFPTKTEVAFSADAAFARPSSVSSHTVIAYGADHYVGGKQGLLDFAKKYSYTPSTVVEFEEFPAIMAGGF